MPRALIRVIEPALPAPLFGRLRAAVLALGGERMRSTYQTTFWFDLQRPSNVAERAILHLRPHLAARNIGGAEWWLSRMRTRNVRVDFHQDRDNALHAREGELAHPEVSSVLFLNRVRGGLLAVTEEAPDPRNRALAPRRLDRLDLVAPAPNRFVLFRGDLTHGVLDEDNKIPHERGRSGGELRLALIVNWWRRRPTEVPTFDERGVYPALREG